METNDSPEKQLWEAAEPVVNGRIMSTSTYQKKREKRNQQLEIVLEEKK